VGEAPGLMAQLREVVEGQWDLTTQFSAEGVPEVSSIARHLNGLFEKLGSSLTNCASSTITLSKISPQLSAVATELAGSSQIQAARAQEIAASVAILESASANLKSIVDLIERTAFQSKLLAINASIEAARAGEKGRAFGAVAEEIQRLSTETAAATGQVSSVIGAIQEQIKKTARAVGVETSGRRHSTATEQDSLAIIAETQAEQAATLNKLAQQSHATCDELVLGMGVFRIAAHRRARTLLEELVVDSDLVSFEQERQETAMRRFIKNHPAFELLYVTDLSGSQVTRNISAHNFEAAYRTNGLGSDWSKRPWFQGARASKATFVSDIYRSAASGQFCFTVARLITNASARAAGVLGADVRVENLLGN
jgi:methyl-accepting chemotaxis protein